MTIPDAEQDRQLPEKLRAELPGILAWAVEGARLWQTEGLGLPDEVRAAIADYRSEMDTLGAFLREQCVAGAAAARFPARELYQAYEAWAHAGGDKPMKERTFSARLTERGLTKKHIEQGKVWLGLRLRSAADTGPGWESPADGC